MCARQYPKCAFLVPYSYLANYLRVACGFNRGAYFIMKRIAAFSLATWSAAAILYFGQHLVALIALSGVVVLGGFDLLRP
jgi:hypothetical protein